jgi:hypothetical protein
MIMTPLREVLDDLLDRRELPEVVRLVRPWAGFQRGTEFEWSDVERAYVVGERVAWASVVRRGWGLFFVAGTGRQMLLAV